MMFNDGISVWMLKPWGVLLWGKHAKKCGNPLFSKPIHNYISLQEGNQKMGLKR